MQQQKKLFRNKIKRTFIFMKVQELYDHITKHMTPEAALMKLLEAGLVKYERLKFEEGEEVHPEMIIYMATMDLGWNLALENRDENEQVRGMCIGTSEYLDSVFPPDSEKMFVY